jgi:phenylacetate-CoA ligase
MFWQYDLECMPRDILEAWQLKQLRSTLDRLSCNVRFYGNLGVALGPLCSLDDVRRLPFTTSADLRDGYPHGFLAVPHSELLRLHTSSGTTGKPKALFFSRRDVDQAAELVARCLVMAGATSHDVLQNMMTYGLFTGALVVQYGAEKVGLLVIPAGPGNSERQLLLMRDFRTTLLHTTPSYALYLADFLEQRGVNPRKELALRKAFIGAESYTEETRHRIEEALGIDVYNSYGLSEMNGPGVAFECEYKSGLHIWEDHFLVEIINPTTGDPVPDGEAGELVLTTLTREAMPLLRYRSRDLTRILPGSCPCGRTHRRLARIQGRTDDMLIVRGANFYPQQIERVLMQVPGVGRNYQIVLDGIDELTVRVEVTPTDLEGQAPHLSGLQATLTEKLRAELLVKPRIELLASGELPVSEGKARRVIDNRTL